MITHTDEPEYITIYHAIDWLSGIVESPLPIFMHEKIVSQNGFSQKQTELLIDINLNIQSGRLKIYGKSYKAVFFQKSSDEPNMPNISLDYPNYEINWAKSKLVGLPHIDNEKHDFQDFESAIHSPANFQLIKASREFANDFGGVLFSLHLVIDEFENLLALDNQGLSMRTSLRLGEIPKDTILELLFFKVSELREIFFQKLSVIRVFGTDCCLD